MWDSDSPGPRYYDSSEVMIVSIYQELRLNSKIFRFPRESAFLREPLAYISPQEHLGASLPLRKQQSTSGLRLCCGKYNPAQNMSAKPAMNVQLIATKASGIFDFICSI